MFLKDIIANDYKIFERMGDENRKANISAVQYVHMLSATTNAKADTWNILEIFGRGEGNALVTDKNEINKRFFTHLEQIKANVPEEYLSIEPEIERQIKEATRELVNSQVRQFREKAESCRITMQDYYQRAEMNASQMVRYQNMVLSIQGKTNPIMDEIRKVASGTYWKFHSFDGRCLRFETRNPTILVHKNPSAGIDITLNMGLYAAVVDIKTMQTKVTAQGGNIVVDGYYHPHVTGHGDICWGTGLTAATGFMKDFRLLDLMELLAANLSNYNSGNPYVSLERFKIKDDTNRGARTSATGVVIRNLCSDCDGDADECDCEDESTTWSEDEEDSTPF